MARERWTALRVDPPTLEPDPVLLARLSALSASSVPVPGRVRRSGARALAVLASAAVVGTTSWAAGALPSTVSPHSSAQQPATTVPASPDAVRSPQPDDVPSPGVLMSPGTPGEATASSNEETAPPTTDERGRAEGQRDAGVDPRDRPSGAGAPDEPGEQPGNENPGLGDGNGNGHGRGNANGHLRPQRPKAAKEPRAPEKQPPRQPQSGRPSGGSEQPSDDPPMSGGKPTAPRGKAHGWHEHG